MVKSKDSILKDYENHVEIQESLIKALKKTLNNLSYSRLGLFVVEIIFVAIIINSGFHWVIGLLMCLPVLAFMAVLKKQGSIDKELNYAEKLLFVYQNEVDLIRTGYQKYDNGKAFANEMHPYGSDLDIYGESSLYAFINRSNTIMGMKLLAESLGMPKEAEQIVARQEAIDELKDYIEETFHFRAGLRNHEPAQLQVIEDKLAYELEGQLAFTHHKLMRFYMQATPVLSLTAIILGNLYGGIFWSALGIYILLNSAILFFNSKHINQVYYGFSGSSSLLNAVAGTVKWTEEIQLKSTYIKSFYGLRITGNALSKQIKQLSAIISAFDVRLNPFLGAIFNLFLLWDMRCAVRLDRWYEHSSMQLIEGLRTISRFEELISLATLSYNQPAWVVPVLSDSFCFETRGLGHPLIAEHKRVTNDYEFSAQSTVDIITGSNMAGKSTFLRTVGINMVLAFCGAPVCALAMKTSVFDILTYMRIKDSLNDQTSTFKAELNRLKMILEGVDMLPYPLVLIDEMLRGTNSKDKYLGSKVFVQHMIKDHTPTLFATHDLQLSEMVDDYDMEVRNYHFDIQLAEGEMKFDYKLKHGACKTFNAALLLKEIGLSFDPISMG